MTNERNEHVRELRRAIIQTIVGYGKDNLSPDEVSREYVMIVCEEALLTALLAYRAALREVNNEYVN